MCYAGPGVSAGPLLGGTKCHSLWLWILGFLELVLTFWWAKLVWRSLNAVLCGSQVYCLGIGVQGWVLGILVDREISWGSYDVCVF